MATTFEIHGPPAATAGSPLADSAFQGTPAPTDSSIFVVPDSIEPTWVRVDADSGQLLPADQGSAQAGLLVVARRLGQGLALLACDDGVLVNGQPAAPFSVLTTRDSLTLAPGTIHYVTERFRPYIGPPTEDMQKQKKKCPCCQLPFEPASRLITCYCAQCYHWETAESHPDKADRLDCFSKVRACLSPSCRRPMTRGEETLTWDPRDL